MRVKKVTGYIMMLTENEINDLKPLAKKLNLSFEKSLNYIVKKYCQKVYRHQQAKSTTKNFLLPKGA